MVDGASIDDCTSRRRGMMGRAWVRALVAAVLIVGVACGGSPPPAVGSATPGGDEVAAVQKRLDDLGKRLKVDDDARIHAGLEPTRNAEYMAVIRRALERISFTLRVMQQSQDATPTLRGKMLERANAALDEAERYTAQADAMRQALAAPPDAQQAAAQAPPEAQCAMFAGGKCILLAPPAQSAPPSVEAEMTRTNALCASVTACQSACSASDQSACTGLGLMYLDGSKGVPKDLAKGFTLIRAACAAKNDYGCAAEASLTRTAETNCQVEPKACVAGCASGEAAMCRLACEGGDQQACVDRCAYWLLSDHSMDGPPPTPDPCAGQQRTIVAPRMVQFIMKELTGNCAQYKKTGYQS
ncbi:MAG: hypothetical protein ACRELB_00175, partial [Polyangiaceae bacterium]